MKSWFSYGGFESEYFGVKQGVGQGRVISAWLFTLYINDLMHRLDGSNFGLHLPWGHCPGILLADDTTVLSNNPRNSQALLDIVVDYGAQWKLKYNVSKSSLVVFNADKALKPNCPYLGEVSIPLTQTVTYAGVQISSSNRSLDRTITSCEKARKLVNMYQDIGLRYGSLNPLCACRIWNNVILPCALYGCAIWSSLSPKEIDILESTQRYF